MENMKKTAVRVTVVTIIVNVALSAIKLLAGIIAKSGAMISDAVHSLSDVLSSFVVIIGVNIAGKDSDEKHPYGHERMECVAAVALSVLLLMTGIFIGYDSIVKVTSGSYKNGSNLEVVALVAAIISIAVKEWMYWFTRGHAKRLKSTAMMADAWHHRSDALSSVGALIGIGASMLGFPIADPIAGFVICVFICKAAIDIFKGAVSNMVDTACDEETTQKIHDTILEFPDVKSLDLLKTRMFGSKIYVDIEISLDGEMRLIDAHAVAQKIHDRLEQDIPEIKHCMIHVNPYGEKESEDSI